MKKTRVISIWNPKGGQGKSMLAINLAAAAVEIGLVPLVICQDQQGTSMHYYRAGNLPFRVINEFPESKPDADLVIIDQQASDWAVPQPSLLVMPLKPDRDQYATYVDAKKMAMQKNKNIITVVTDGQAHRASEKATSDHLKSKGAHVIPSSGVFSRASKDYRTIFDPALNGAYKIKERRRDISGILGAIMMEAEFKEERAHVEV